MIKYFREMFSSKEQQYVASAEEELRTYKADRIRLMRSLAMTNAAVVANEASIKALEGCLPAMREGLIPVAKVTAGGALAQVLAANNVKASVAVGPGSSLQVPEDAPKAAFAFGTGRADYK